MTRMKALATIVVLAGLILIPVTLGSGSGGHALAQGDSGGLTEQQRREMEQKYQEQWDTLERIQKRQEDTGRRLQEAEQRRRDAEKRQRKAEGQLRDQENEDK